MSWLFLSQFPPHPTTFFVAIFCSNNYEVTTIKAREQAERCQLDRVEQYAAQCGELHKSMLNNMNELQKGINCALVEIEKFEGGLNVIF